MHKELKIGAAVSYPLLLFLFFLFRASGTSLDIVVLAYVGIFTVCHLAMLDLPFRIVSGKPVATRHIVVSWLFTALLFMGLLISGGVFKYLPASREVREFLPLSQNDLNVFAIFCGIWIVWTVFLCFRTRWRDVTSLVRFQCWWLLGTNVITSGLGFWGGGLFKLTFGYNISILPILLMPLIFLAVCQALGGGSPSLALDSASPPPSALPDSLSSDGVADGKPRARRTGCFVLMLKIFVGICALAALFVILQMCLYNKDYSLQRASEAQWRVREQLGSQATSNEYYVVFGLLQGYTSYYRCDTTPEAVQAYVTSRDLAPISDSKAIGEFRSPSLGTPYWWKSDRGKHVEYYGKESGWVTISWDQRTGRCLILE